MTVLVVDVGGTHVKLLATGESDPRRFDSGPTMTAEQMVAGVKELASALEVRRGDDRLPGTGSELPAGCRAV